MLVGAHVSSAGGLRRAWERGVERGCDAFQIFNQSPRMWRPTSYGEEDVAALRAGLDEAPPRTVVIHAVYLLNCASDDPEVRGKSLEALKHALRLGDAIGAAGVVIHPGSAKTGPLGPALERAGAAFREALEETGHCPLLLENTAGAGGTIGRSFEELAELLDRAGGDTRLGACLDSCHLFASGYDIRTIESLDAMVDGFDAQVGLDRLRCLHVNDSQTDLGSNRDRHENLPDGRIGRAGLAAFLSHPRFDGLPALLEGGPGMSDNASWMGQIAMARELRAEGRAARGLG